MAEYFEGPTGRKRLLRTYEKTRPDCFDDALYNCAVTIEDAMILGGATPGVDYSRLDLFKLAMKLAPDFSAGMTTGIPDSHPHAGLPPSDPIDDLKLQILEYLKQHGPTNHVKLGRAFHGRPKEVRAATIRLHKEGVLQVQVVRAGPDHAASAKRVYALKNGGA